MAQMSNDRRGVRGIGKNESSEIVSGERATYSPRIKPLRRNETSGVFRPFRPNNCFLKTFWTEVRNQGAISGAHSLIKCSGLSNLIVDESASLDRKSTRLNSSHGYISYAVFCLKKKHKRCI